MASKLPADFAEAMRTGIMPDFPERGLYAQYDKNWIVTGYSVTPAYSGQVACRFPKHWAPSLCFLASKIADPITEPPAV